MDTDLRQPIVLPLRHYLLVGVGDWGWTSLCALAHALNSSHPELIDANEWLALSPDGWGWLKWLTGSAMGSIGSRPHLSNAPIATISPDWQKNMSEASQPVLDEIFHCATGQDKTQRLKALGYEALHGDQIILDIYLIGRIDDPYLQTVLLDAVALLRRARPKALPFTLGFFLGVDSPRLARIPADERQALVTFIDRLDGFLAQDRKREDASEDGVGWCYLVDSLDRDGRPIAPISGARDVSADPGLLLAQVVAGYLALVIGSEMHERSEYRRLSLDNLVKSAALDPERGYCSSFSCAAQVLPVREIEQQSARRLGADLLRQFDLARTADRGVASELAAEFFIVHNLRRPVVEGRLSRDEDGKPVHFDLDPADFALVPDEELVDRILSWDAFIARNRMRPITDQMARETELLLVKARYWIQAQIDKLVRQSPGGVATARHFCETLARDIQRESQFSLSGKPPPGCLGLLFGLQNGTPKSDTLPELGPFQSALERALAERVEPLAVWVRYILIALFEMVFVLAAWNYIRPALNFSLGDAVGLPPSLVDPWIFPVSLILINLLAAWRHIARIELRIANARIRLIQTIQRKYVGIIRWNVLHRSAEIYAQLGAALEQERAALERLSATAMEVAGDLIKEVENDPGYQPLCLERCLVGPAEYEQFAVKYPTEEIQALVREWWRAKPMPNWRTADRCQVRLSVLAFAQAVESSRLAQMSIESYTAAREDELALPRLVDALQRQTRLQLALGSWSTVHPCNFLGIFDNRMTQIEQWVIEREWTSRVETRDAGRIVYAPTLHGLPIRDLKIWEGLR